MLPHVYLATLLLVCVFLSLLYTNIVFIPVSSGELMAEEVIRLGELSQS